MIALNVWKVKNVTLQICSKCFPRKVTNFKAILPVFVVQIKKKAELCDMFLLSGA